MAKPAEFFVGITDFFSILLPGAVMTFVLEHIAKSRQLHILSYEPAEKTAQYAAFLVSAYVIGHVIDLIGASVIDTIYDLTFAHWKRSSDTLSLWHWMLRSPKRLAVETKDWFYNIFSPSEKCLFSPTEKSSRLENELLRAASKFAGAECPPGINVYKWSRAWTMLRSGSASAEVERMQANSKFFRGMIIVSAITAIYLFFADPNHPPHARAWAWACVALAAAFFLRFCDLRWKAVEQTYAFYIALHQLQLRNEASHDTHGNSAY